MDVREHTRAEREAQLELYAGLTPEQWATPSLCAGWTLHELLAHTTMPFRYSLPKVLTGLVAARGNFDRMADRAAHRDAAELSPDELVASLRDNLDHPWSPPGGGPVGALSHDVVHGMDASVPLGREDLVEPERVALVLGSMQPRHLRSFGTDLTGVRLQATDVDWACGEGRVVEGRAQDLLRAVCGRPSPVTIYR